MLTKLRLKNWRSVREAEIDLAPITVFIGANSSGKTNILDALRFHRDTLQKGIEQIVLELGYINIQTNPPREHEQVELEFSYDLAPQYSELISETLILKFGKRDVPFKFGHKLCAGDVTLKKGELEEFPPRDEIRPVPDDVKQNLEKIGDILGYLNDFVLKRWQIIGDSLVPPIKLSSREGGSPYIIEFDSRNLMSILSFMEQSYPEVYGALKNDLRWLLNHVGDVDVWRYREEGEVELLVREATGRTAPTVSSGTRRIIAMLTAVYALDMPQKRSSGSKLLSAKDPGLVVIEEPDTALNPGILRNFVEQLRYYVTGEHPRQFILTTHNPAFLDYFEPEEVRVVSRDENGYTTVEAIKGEVSKIWLDEYGLGGVWTTNSFGGLAE